MKFLKRSYTFYSRRAAYLHIGYFLGLYPSTFLIAIVVGSGAFFLNVVYPGYARMYTRSWKDILFEFFIHYCWLFLLPREISHESILILCVSLFLYIILHGPRRIFRYYTDVRKTAKQILT